MNKADPVYANIFIIIASTFITDMKMKQVFSPEAQQL